MRFTYPPGSTPLDGFTIEQGLGVGGFGEVYRAVSDVGKRVALKKIQRNLDIELRGVKQCINLKHVNLISLWDIKTSRDGESWVVMEYVPGPSLRDIIQAHPNGLPEEEVKRWFISTASGVAYLHQQDIVHRDLKPGNIFLDEETQVIKIGDYGLSKYMNTSRRSGQTESVGTCHYMAPEIGRGVYGREIDIYALGIILFEVLTGDVPFDGESTQEIIIKHLTDDPKLDRVPAGFRKVIRTALQKDPDLRYHSVPEMLADMPWPEIVENRQKIVAWNTLGSFSSTSERKLGSLEITHHRPSRIEQGTQDSQEIIDGELAEEWQAAKDNRMPVADIIFGPLKDLSQTKPDNQHRPVPEVSFVNSVSVAGDSKSSQRPAVTIPSAAENSKPGEVSRNPTPTSSISTMVRVPTSIEIDYAPTAGHEARSIKIDEPIARSIHYYCQNLLHWWTYGNVSTPIKVILLAAASLIVVINSAWLLPLAFTLGAVYLGYYLIRTWWLGGNEALKPNRKALRKALLDDLKIRLRARSWGCRAIELLGSILVAAVACATLSLLGLALGGASFQPSKAIWQGYGWLATTSFFACTSLLLVSKFWEDRTGENSMRRFSMVVIGVLVGCFSFGMANAFAVNLSDAPQFGSIPVPSPKITIKGMPILPAMILYNAGLFGILRWWLLADPVRSTRLSILLVSFALVWSCLFSMLLELPILPNGILAVVISVSTQLAAPWWSMEDAQTDIRAETVTR